MKKYTALILVLVLVCCLFAACRASVETPTTKNTQPTTAATTPTHATTYPATHPSTTPTMDTTHEPLVPNGTTGMDTTGGHTTESEAARARRPY